MDTLMIVKALEVEISNLERARDLLAGEKKPVVSEKVSRTKTRMVSPEGRARIAAAQKLRWAKHRRKAS